MSKKEEKWAFLLAGAALLAGFLEFKSLETGLLIAAGFIYLGAWEDHIVRRVSIHVADEIERRKNGQS